MTNHYQSQSNGRLPGVGRPEGLRLTGVDVAFRVIGPGFSHSLATYQVMKCSNYGRWWRIKFQTDNLAFLMGSSLLSSPGSALRREKTRSLALQRHSCS